MTLRFLLLLFFVFEFTYAQEDASLLAVRQYEQKRIRVIEDISPTVVCILTPKEDNGGSGVVFHEAGYAFTNVHVVAEMLSTYKGGLNDGKLYQLDIIGLDPGGDVAIVKLNGKFPFKSCRLGDSNQVRVGDMVMALGNPFLLAEDYTPTITHGVVSGVHRFQEGNNRLLVYGNCIQVDTSINPGNSGGPLFTERGTVIGINGRGSFEERGRVNVGLGYAISMEQILNFVPDLMATKICLHGTLSAIFIENDSQLVCQQIDKTSTLAMAGMLPGDLLLSIDGTSLQTVNQLVNQISTYPANWPISVVFKQKDVEKKVHIRLNPLAYLDTSKDKGNEPRSDKDQKPKDMPQEFDLKNAGKIRDADRNRQEALRLMRESQFYANGKKKKIRSIKCELHFRDARDQLVEEIQLDWQGQESIRLSFCKESGEEEVIVLNGKSQLAQTQAGVKVDFRFYFEKISFLYAWFSLLDDDGGGYALMELTGGDKVNGYRAFCLKLRDKVGMTWNYFINVVDAQKKMQSRLLKTGYSYDELESAYGEQIVQEQVVDDLVLPKRIDFVYGLNEKIIRSTLVEKVAIQCE